MLDTPQVPEWLVSILSEKFFISCIIHVNAKKNDRNVFCLDCLRGICPHCIAHHHSHRLLQIRRYVYHDVIRIADADKLFDCAQIQTYTNNNAKVVFLNQRPLTRPPRASGSVCITCDRTLQESSLFCCIFCKLQHILGTGLQLSLYLRNCEFLFLADDGQMSPDSVLDPGSMRTDSGSSSGGVVMDTVTTEIVRKKRSSLRPACRPDSRISESMMMNRRKGTPHRSPLH